MEDAKLELQDGHEADINLILIQKFLENCAPALNYDGRQFYSQLLNFLIEDKRKALLSTSTFFSTMRIVVQKPPVFSLYSYSDYMRSKTATEGTKTRLRFYILSLNYAVGKRFFFLEFFRI